MTLGEKIQKLRKQKGLSQETLAEKVSVTRQTISKWELNQSLPDLNFIAQLSEIFNVSADYLIKDEMSEPNETPHRKRHNLLTEKAKRMILLVFSALSLLACMVCFICDYFISGTLSWSLAAAVSVIALWLLLLPSLAAKTKVIFKTILTACIIPMPLLAVFALLLKRPVIFTLGAGLSLIGMGVIWAVYGIFKLGKKSLWRSAGWVLLLFIPVPIAIMHMAAYFLPQQTFDFSSVLFNSLITLALAMLCFGIDYWLGRKRREEADQK